MIHHVLSEEGSTGNEDKDTLRTRHMMKRYHYVREGVDSNQHAWIWITTTAQVADMGTKNLGRILLHSFKEIMNLYLSKSLSRTENPGGLLRYAYSSGIC
jgi:hypothetical protein